MKKQIKLLGLLVFTVLAFAACNSSEKKDTAEESEVLVEETVDMDEIKGEIQALEDAYSAGEKNKDADAVAAYYSEDAISYSRNTKPLVGREAIRESIANNMTNDTTGNTSVYKIVDLFVEGDGVVEVGSWTDFDTSGKQLGNGNYMSYFQKRNGKYICVRDMSTTVSPVKSDM